MEGSVGSIQIKEKRQTVSKQKLLLYCTLPKTQRSHGKSPSWRIASHKDSNIVKLYPTNPESIENWTLFIRVLLFFFFFSFFSLLR